MYQYPTAAAVPEPERPAPPPSVLKAVKLMYVGAAGEAVSLIVGLLTRSSYKAAILKVHPGYTTAQLHTAESDRALPLVIGAVVAIALWLWMAWSVRRGQNWARVLSAVFFGISTVSLLASVIVIRDVPSLIIGVLIWAVGLAVIVLIFSGESAPYYRQTPA